MSFTSSSSFSVSGATDANGDPDLVYYNALIINNKSNTPLTCEDDPKAVFSEIRAKPLINNVSNFDFSILRFDMNGSGKKLPLFIPEIESQVVRNPTYNINQTVYTIGAMLNYVDNAGVIKNIYQSVNINFVPENKNAPIPNPIVYPNGLRASDVKIAQTEQIYKYGNIDYRCVKTPLPISADKNIFNSLITYNTGDIIFIVSTSAIYRSIQDNNTNHSPLTSPLWWSVIPVMGVGNISGQNYYYLNSVSGIYTVYNCINNNSDTDPFTTPSNWNQIYVYPFPDIDPEDFLIVPKPSYMPQDLNGNYYYLSTYDGFVQMINTAFFQLWTDLLAKTSAQLTGSDTLSGITNNNSPYMVYDPNSNLFSINYEKAYAVYPTVNSVASPQAGWYPPPFPILTNTVSSSPNYYPLVAPTATVIQPIIQHFFNENLWNLFASFPVERVNNKYLPILTTKSMLATSPSIVYNSIDNYSTPYYLLTYNTGINSVVAPVDVCAGTLPAQFSMIQNYQTNSTLWSPVGSIVFCSTLPIFNEVGSEPSIYGNNDSIGVITSSSAPFIPLITDMSIALFNAHEYRGFVSYAPSGEYRLSSTTGQGSAINNIEIQIFWKNRLDGKLYPIRLSNFSNIGIKMLFRRKGIKY
jgi:hypothetical protein